MKPLVLVLVGVLIAQIFVSTLYSQVGDFGIRGVAHIPDHLTPVRSLRFSNEDRNPLEVAFEVVQCRSADKSGPLVYIVSVCQGSYVYQLDNEENVDRLMSLRHDFDEVTKDVRGFGLDESQADKLHLAADLQARKMRRMLLAVPAVVSQCETFDIDAVTRVISPRMLIARKSPLRYDGSLYHYTLQSLIGKNVPPLPDPAAEARRNLNLNA